VYGLHLLPIDRKEIGRRADERRTEEEDEPKDFDADRRVVFAQTESYHSEPEDQCSYCTDNAQRASNYS
jgi:hypothetical protein